MCTGKHERPDGDEDSDDCSTMFLLFKSVQIQAFILLVEETERLKRTGVHVGSIKRKLNRILEKKQTNTTVGSLHVGGMYLRS